MYASMDRRGRGDKGKGRYRAAAVAAVRGQNVN